MAVGPSRDRTGEIADELAAGDERLRVVDNPVGKTPHALNLGIADSRYNIIVRVDGHGELGDGYIERAVELLGETGAANVGGVMDAQGRTPFEEAVAYVYTSPFGLGGAAFHQGDVPAGPAETVFLGVFARCDLHRRRWLRRDHAPRPGLGAQLSAAELRSARSGSPLSCGSPTGRVPACARWPSRCMTRGLGGARLSAGTPRPPVRAIWRRRPPWSGSCGGTWPACSDCGPDRGCFVWVSLAPSGTARDSSRGSRPRRRPVSPAAGCGCRSCWRRPLIWPGGGLPRRSGGLTAAYLTFDIMS